MLTPDEVRARRFLVSMRGYDRDEVHAFLGALADQIEALSDRANELEQRLHAAESDVGHAGAVAESAGQDPAPQAAPEASLFEALGKETQRILEAAEDAGAQITRRARQNADKELQEARRQAARLIAEGERRREAIEEVVSRLEESRKAVAGDLRKVGRVLEGAIRDLVPPPETATVREALAQSARVDAAEASHGPAQEDGPAAAPAPEPSSVPESPSAPQPPSAASPGSGGSSITPAATAGVPAPGGGVPASTAQTNGESIAEPSGAAPSPNGHDQVHAPAQTEPAHGREADAESPVAESPNAAPTVAEPLPAEPLPAEPSAADGEATADEEVSEPQGGPGALRTSALEPLHPKMVRRFKRGLSDVQNLALDRIRRLGDKGDLDALLPTEPELEPLASVAAEFLDQAYRAGVSSASVLAGRPLAGSVQPAGLSEEFGKEAAEELSGRLGASLRMGLSASEASSALNSRVGSIFSELKGTVADELSANHLIRAYERGLRDAWEAGGVTHRKWVLGKEPRCPEGRCRQNDRSGSLELERPFPSGHQAPPVHVGCTCTTIPVSES